MSPDNKTSIYQSYRDKQTRTEGYRAVIKHQDGFLAAGSGGRIDWISVAGKIIRSEKYPGEIFNCLLYHDQKVIAAGDKGTIMVSSEAGIFLKIESGTGKNINTLASLNGIVIAGADGGNILVNNMNGSFRKINLPLKGNVVSVSANSSECFGVTDEGEIIRSKNGIIWDILDFNSIYADFYEPCHFTKILVTENRIFVAGVINAGSPALYLSHLGGVWTERSLYYTDDQGISGFLMDAPNDIYYDDTGNQLFLACDEGKLIVLPSCTQCNELTVISRNDLKGIAGNEHNVLITGENFFLNTINLK